MNAKAAAVVWGALTADALALGAHWIYDTEQIDSEIGRVDRLMAPRPNSFHSTKKAGEFTHYGDQTMVLLASLAESGTYRPEAFAAAWQALFADYKGYFDHATKETLKNIEAGQGPKDAGSKSTDLSGAARIAPLACLYANDVQAMVDAARDQTAMTHNSPDVVDSAELFARTLGCVLDGQPPLEALQSVQREHFDRPPFDRWIADGVATATDATRTVIKRFGQICDVKAVFPGVVHLIAAYPDNYEEALIANVMAGGDSAARGMLAGTVIGARVGLAGIPTRWRDGLVAKHRIQGLLDQIKALNG